MAGLSEAPELKPHGLCDGEVEVIERTDPDIENSAGLHGSPQRADQTCRHRIIRVRARIGHLVKPDNERAIEQRTVTFGDRL